MYDRFMYAGIAHDSNSSPRDAGKTVSIPANVVLPQHLPIELLAHRPDLGLSVFAAGCSLGLMLIWLVVKSGK
jgi:hypothetical protein